MLATGWYAKNLILFGTFSSSSWAGMNLNKMIVATKSDRDLQTLVDRRELGAIVAVGAFNPPAVYDPRFAHLGNTGVPALDQQLKRNGEPNFNNEVYIDVSNQFTRQLREHFLHHPGDYARAVTRGVRYAFLPATDYPFVWSNVADVETLDRLCSRAVLGQPRRYFHVAQRGAYYSTDFNPQPGQLALGLVIIYALAAVGAPVLAWRRRSDRPTALLLAYLGLTTLYAFIVTTAVELGENNRFRFETDPIAVAAATVVVAHCVRMLSGRLRPGRRGVPTP